MNVTILQLLDGARAAKGLTVIIDVFRAFSVACYVAGNGAKGIITVGNLEKAYEMKRRNPSFVLMGERQGKQMPGFDYGNSPAEIEDVDFTGRTVIHTTSAGTQGIANARGAREIITGSFVNARAIIAYIKSRQPDEVSLVCMGTEAVSPSDEDTLFGHYLKNGLAGQPADFQALKEHLHGCPAAQKFFDQDKPWAPRQDFDLCLDLDRFNFVLRADKGADGHYVLTRVAMP